MALIEVTGQNLAGTLAFGQPQEQFDRLLEILQPKLIGEPAIALERAARRFSGPRESMILDTALQRKRSVLEKFLN